MEDPQPDEPAAEAAAADAAFPEDDVFFEESNYPNQEYGDHWIDEPVGAYEDDYGYDEGYDYYGEY